MARPHVRAAPRSASTDYIEFAPGKTTENAKKSHLSRLENRTATGVGGRSYAVVQTRPAPTSASRPGDPHSVMWRPVLPRSWHLRLHWRGETACRRIQRADSGLILDAEGWPSGRWRWSERVAKLVSRTRLPRRPLDVRTRGHGWQSTTRPVPEYGWSAASQTPLRCLRPSAVVHSDLSTTAGSRRVARRAGM